MVGSFADDVYSFKGGDEMLVTAVTRSAELTRTEGERQRQESSEVQVSNQAPKERKACLVGRAKV